MTCHQPQPTFDHRRALETDRDVDGIGAELAIREKPFDAVELRGAVIATALRLTRGRLAKKAVAREDAANLIIARGASQHGTVRTYHGYQKVFEIDDCPVIPNEVGQFSRDEDETSPSVLRRGSIEANHAKLRGLSKGARYSRSNVDRLLSLPVHPDKVGWPYVDGGERKDGIAGC